jgi:hypothetical protein
MGNDGDTDTLGFGHGAHREVGGLGYMDLVWMGVGRGDKEVGLKK